MKIRAAFFLLLFLFLSSVNAYSNVLTDDEKTCTLIESQVLVEQISDDFEVLVDSAPFFTALLVTSADTIDVDSANVISHYIYKPPKSFSFIS